MVEPAMSFCQHAANKNDQKRQYAIERCPLHSKPEFSRYIPADYRYEKLSNDAGCVRKRLLSKAMVSGVLTHNRSGFDEVGHALGIVPGDGAILVGHVVFKTDPNLPSQAFRHEKTVGLL